MSIVPGTDWQFAPDIAAYQKRDSIEAGKRCRTCDGLGLMRMRNSTSGKDWKDCYTCKGTGLQPLPTGGTT